MSSETRAAGLYPRVVHEVAFTAVDPSDPEVRIALLRYFSEIAERMAHVVIVEDDFLVDDFTPPGGVFFLVRSGEAVVGCGAVRNLGNAFGDDGIGELKRMWIAPDHRGLGLGSRLLRTLEAAARDLGYERLRLDTHAVLVEAIHLYESNGYRAIPPYNDHPDPTHFFEKSLAIS